MGETVATTASSDDKKKQPPSPRRRPAYNMAGLVPVPSDLNDPNRLDWSAVK